MNCTTYSYKHKCSKWYHVVYHFLKEAALVNAFILFKKAYPDSKLTSYKFRKDVARSLCDSRPKSRKRNAAGTVVGNIGGESRLTERHFPSVFADKKRLQCVVCSNTEEHPVRRLTIEC